MKDHSCVQEDMDFFFMRDIQGVGIPTLVLSEGQKQMQNHTNKAEGSVCW